MCNVTWRGSHAYLNRWTNSSGDISRHWAILGDFAIQSGPMQRLHGSRSMQKRTNFKPCTIYTAVGPFACTEPTYWMNSRVRQYNRANWRPKEYVVMVSLPAQFQNCGRVFLHADSAVKDWSWKSALAYRVIKHFPSLYTRKEVLIQITDVSGLMQTFEGFNSLI